MLQFAVSIVLCADGLELGGYFFFFACVNVTLIFAFFSAAKIFAVVTFPFSVILTKIRPFRILVFFASTPFTWPSESMAVLRSLKLASLGAKTTKVNLGGDSFL